MGRNEGSEQLGPPKLPDSPHPRGVPNPRPLHSPHFSAGRGLLGERCTHSGASAPRSPRGAGSLRGSVDPGVRAAPLGPGSGDPGVRAAPFTVSSGDPGIQAAPLWLGSGDPGVRASPFTLSSGESGVWAAPLWLGSWDPRVQAAPFGLGSRDPGVRAAPSRLSSENPGIRAAPSCPGSGDPGVRGPPSPVPPSSTGLCGGVKWMSSGEGGGVGAWGGLGGGPRSSRGGAGAGRSRPSPREARRAVPRSSARWISPRSDSWVPLASPGQWRGGGHIRKGLGPSQGSAPSSTPSPPFLRTTPSHHLGSPPPWGAPQTPGTTLYRPAVTSAWGGGGRVRTQPPAALTPHPTPLPAREGPQAPGRPLPAILRGGPRAPSLGASLPSPRLVPPTRRRPGPAGGALHGLHCVRKAGSVGSQ